MAFLCLKAAPNFPVFLEEIGKWMKNEKTSTSSGIRTRATQYGNSTSNPDKVAKMPSSSFQRNKSLHFKSKESVEKVFWHQVSQICICNVSRNQKFHPKHWRRYFILEPFSKRRTKFLRNVKSNTRCLERSIRSYDVNPTSDGSTYPRRVI